MFYQTYHRGHTGQVRVNTGIKAHMPRSAGYILHYSNLAVEARDIYTTSRTDNDHPRPFRHAFVRGMVAQA
jgi:hypothetical protein